MLRALLGVFRSYDPLGAMGQNFSAMLTLADEMTVAAGEMFFTGSALPEARTNLYQHDVRLNQLERKVRRQVVAHLAMPGNHPHISYSVMLFSLVKDVERIGDYAKNLSEVVDIRHSALAEDEIASELQEIRQGVEDVFESLSGVFASGDRRRAVELILQRRDAAHRCDALLERIARSDYDACNATALALGTRYYKRIGGHVLNVLSSVVMPIHKIDYYDEDETPDMRPS
jgi:Na+/phosphate symporter